jgi:enoyl-CoA hydratase
LTERYKQFDSLQFERPAIGVLRIVMSRPGRLNAADAAMHRELAEIWRAIDADPEVRSVIVPGLRQSAVMGDAGGLTG